LSNIAKNGKNICLYFTLFIVMKILGCEVEEQARGTIGTAENEGIRAKIDRKKETSLYFISFGLIFYALYYTISIPPANPALGMALILFLLGYGCMAFVIVYVFWLARKMCSGAF
jgi:hypothetical protein